MMQLYGWRVVEYSNEGSTSRAEHVEILSREELLILSKRESNSHFFDNDVHNEVLKTAFYDRVAQHMKELAKPGDIVCHPFGPIGVVMCAVPECLHVESGIGYVLFKGALSYRIFESEVWKAYHTGRAEEVMGSNVHWVAPNYYDLDDWDVTLEPDKENPYILFMGRIKVDKGMRILGEMALRLPTHRFVLCGQGDASQWLISPNMEYMPPIHGRARSKLMGEATVVVCPSDYVEPFCGVNVEAQLCGTPVISTDFGAFVETIEQGKTGWRCHMLQDYVESVKLAPTLDRQYIADRARSLYSLERVGGLYNMIFKQIADMRGKGWYSEVSHLHPS
jgi:glycosyltransferase involved in cell wall biosynthesis